MNINELFKLQEKLEENVNGRNEITKEERIESKLLAIKVELGELANNWRGFKYWKKDKTPLTKGTRETYDVQGKTTTEECNPLLEEYVDVLHLVMSIGIEEGYKHIDIKKKRIEEGYKYIDIEKEKQDYLETGITFKDTTLLKQFNNLFYFVVQYEDAENQGEDKEDKYIDLFLAILSLGEMLGYTWNEIVAEYVRKNEINHNRQVNGY